MIFREAKVSDIHGLHVVRLSVKENELHNHDLVKETDYANYLTDNGKGWLCEINNVIIGFAIADIKSNRAWALFIHPQYEGKGIGKELHDRMLDWYFNRGNEKIWLTTSPNTRAEKFYRQAGWEEKSKEENGEIRFELTFNTWNRASNPTKHEHTRSI